MRKNLISALVLLGACASLAACGTNNGGGQPSGSLETAADTAARQVGVSYSAFAGSKGISMAGTKLIMHQSYDKYDFDFEYSVTPIKEYGHEYVKVNGDVLSVEIPTYTELDPDYTGAEGQSPKETYVGYKLNASVKYVSYDGKTEGAPESTKLNTEILSKSFNIKVNAEKTKPVWEKIETVRTKAKDETVVTSGYVVAFMNNTDGGEFKNGVWIADGNAGLMLYGGALPGQYGNLHIGDLVFVVGKSSPYNGLMEVKPDAISKDFDTTRGVKAAEFKEVDEAGFKALAQVNCNDPIILKGAKLASKELPEAKQGKETSLKFKVGATTVTYFLNKHTSLEMRTAVIEYLTANKDKTFDIKTVCGIHEGAIQLNGAQISDAGGIVENFSIAA